MIDYDPDDRYPVHCVQGGVANLDAFPANGMHTAVEGVLRYLWKLDESKMEHLPFVVELDRDGVQHYHIYHLPDGLYEKYTGEK